jgi:hypothetical protein
MQRKKNIATWKNQNKKIFLVIYLFLISSLINRYTRLDTHRAKFEQ